MAVESPPWAEQTGSFSAEQTRRAVFAQYARTGANSPGIIAGGLLSTTDLQMTAPVSGLTVNVSTGECIIGGSEGGAQGGYYARATSTTNLSISAANATNARIDTVCATVSDSLYTEPTGGSGNQWALQVVTGTATAGATLVNLNGAAALPLSSLLLGYVLVPALATNIITADIANKATVVPLLASSNYLALVASGAVAITYGFTTVTWPGASGFSNTITVSHGLPRTPSAVLYGPLNMSGAPFSCSPFNNGTPDSTHIQACAYTPGISPAISTTCILYWVAIG